MNQFGHWREIIKNDTTFFLSADGFLGLGTEPGIIFFFIFFNETIAVDYSTCTALRR